MTDEQVRTPAPGQPEPTPPTDPSERPLEDDPETDQHAPEGDPHA